MRGDAKGTRLRALRRPLYFLAMIGFAVRSMALPCFRTGASLSCDGVQQEWSRCGTWRPANAWRRWKGTTRALRRPLYFCDDLAYCVGQRRCRVSGRAARRVCVERQDAQGVGRGDRRMRGDAGRAFRARALRRPLYFVMIWLRRRSERCYLSGRAARRVWVVRQDAQGGGDGDRECLAAAERALELRALRRPLCA